MLIRFSIALALGAMLGIEREVVGKEAGVRTEMLVAGGASIFAMVALVFPYITSASFGTLPDPTAANSAVGVIANIVVGIGFLGAGLIIHNGEHTRNLTTSALIWMTAAIGILCGLGLFMFALATAVIMTVLLYLLRALHISPSEHVELIPRNRK